MSYNVLLVDDSPLARKIVRKTLLMSGLELGEVREAGNGREALSLLREHWMDVVFADINMPEMTGHQMIEQMAKDHLLASVPVVVISTERSQTRIEHLMQLGVKAWLTKPLTPEAVREVVQKVLSKEGSAP